jgi:hypothetical protein
MRDGLFINQLIDMGMIPASVSTVNHLIEIVCLIVRRIQKNHSNCPSQAHEMSQCGLWQELVAQFLAHV